ncbi:MAG: NAD(P)H-dependent oxidoreductase, partial [Verrucomicrobiota bacterium]
MSSKPLNVLAVVGSLHSDSVTRVVVNHAAARLKAEGCVVDVLDLEKESLPLYNPDTAEAQPAFA